MIINDIYQDHYEKYILIDKGHHPISYINFAPRKPINAFFLGNFTSEEGSMETSEEAPGQDTNEFCIA